MTKGKVIVVNTRANNNIDYKVLNSIGSDMGWVKWSLGVVVVEIVAGGMRCLINYRV